MGELAQWCRRLDEKFSLPSGLHCEEIDFQPLGRQMLAAVEAVAGVEMS